MWASYEKSKCDAKLASIASTSNAEFKSESLLFSVIYSDPICDSMLDSVIVVNVTSANQFANYWILDTGATNHITGNRHLFETFHSMAKGEDQVKMANNSFVDADSSGTITLSVNRPNVKPAKIVLQHFFLCARLPYK